MHILFLPKLNEKFSKCYYTHCWDFLGLLALNYEILQCYYSHCYAYTRQHYYTHSMYAFFPIVCLYLKKNMKERNNQLKVSSLGKGGKSE